MFCGYDHNLVQVLNVLPELVDSVPKRIFSQQLFHDSKRFEQGVERRLLAILRKAFPEELEKDENYLDQIGIVENPKLTLVSGKLRVSAGEQGTDKTPGASIIDLSQFPGGTGLTAETIKFLVHTGTFGQNLSISDPREQRKRYRSLPLG